MKFAVIFFLLFIIAILSIVLILSDIAEGYNKWMDKKMMILGILLCLFEFTVGLSCLLTSYRFAIGVLP